MRSGLPGPRPCADTHEWEDSIPLSQLILKQRQSDLFICSVPSRKRCSLSASAGQGCPRVCPCAQAGPGDVTCSRTPRGTPGEQEHTQELGAWCNMQELSNGLSPLFPECLPCTWNESYPNPPQTTKRVHWILNEYLRCLSFPFPVGKETPT